MDVVVPSLLGDNLAARLRSTSLALIGVVGAAALATVGLTLQHGVPLVSSGPIHDPAKAEVAPARAVGVPAPAPRPARRAAVAATRDSGGRAPVSSPPGVPAPSGPSPVEEDGSAPALTAEPSPEGGGGGGAAKRRPPSRATPKPSPAPAPQPAPASGEQPVATPSSEPPPPVAEPPPAEPSPVPGNGNAYGKGGGNGPDGSGPPGLAGK